MIGKQQRLDVFFGESLKLRAGAQRFDPLAGYGAPWAPPPDWSPPPFNYWGFSVVPVFDPYYQEWGFWEYGFWIPLPNQS